MSSTSRKNVAYKASGRKRIAQIQHDISTANSDGSGGRVPNWQTVSGLGNVPMEFLTWSPYQQFIAQQQYPGVTSRATMRYRKSTPVNATMRVEQGTHIYKIRAVLNYDENDEVIQLYLEEQQAVGSNRV